jgi:uncharacterized protein YidB (DUF937 family)
MSLFDSVVGMLTGDGSGDHPSGALMQHLGDLLSSNGAGGGLSGLVQSFEQSGLGHVIGSWVGTGDNLPISPDQIQQVFGSGKLAELAQSLGLDTDQVASQLSQVLPHLIDSLTPNGQVPADGVGQADILGAIGSLFGRSSPTADS